MKFRFLYGRWIRASHIPAGAVSRGSDSSMVDEYHRVKDIRLCTSWFRFLYGRWIPCQQASTSPAGPFRFLYGRWIQRYCNAYQDRYGVQIPLWSMNTVKESVHPQTLQAVQIPLWSMNTLLKYFCACSSSCSDSSMVDEYVISSRMLKPKLHVQIPLWSMNTTLGHW